MKKEKRSLEDKKKGKAGIINWLLSLWLIVTNISVSCEIAFKRHNLASPRHVMHLRYDAPYITAAAAWTKRRDAHFVNNNWSADDCGDD